MMKWIILLGFVIIISLTYGENANFGLENLRYYNPSQSVKFYLYTRQHHDTPRQIFNGELDHLFVSGFRHLPVKVLVHGWKSSANHASNILVKNAFLKYYDVNVIVVDWSSGMDENPSDPLAVAFGMYLATFLQFLGRVGVPLSQVHVVAHSLGAQAAGHAGRYCGTGKIGYISALDPPGGTWENSAFCIGRGDAEYVEIIHTFISGGMLIYPYGHVDFYPNGGEMMPGCLSSDYWCSHSRAYEYFAESIGLENGFVGRQCRDYSEMRYGGCTSLNHTLQMGGHTTKNASGIYFLETNPQEPFHKGFR